ncbi:MAG: hypothetical protein HY738_04760 [Bacteroidia bacterium]|nr:hypothetical protein [Bacteroidia bacterium]
MKKYFEIQYVLRYYDEKEYASEIIKAISEKRGVKKVYKKVWYQKPKTFE